MSIINRITLFKIPNAEHQKLLVEKYRTMKQEALKDGKEYIISLQAGPTFEDQRRQGYTVAVVSQFSNLADMKYYDNDCEAHKRLKQLAEPFRDGLPMTVYYEPVVSSGVRV